jgi:hypothetical protein
MVDYTTKKNTYLNYMVFGGGGLQTPGIHDRGNE